MPTMSDLKRAWLLKMLGLTSSTLAESDLLAQLYSGNTLSGGVRNVGAMNALSKPSVYFFPNAPTALATSSSMGNNTLRIGPWLLQEPVRLAKIGCEITAIGDVGAVFRMGIYKADSFGQPSTLLLDAGAVAADVVALPEASVDITLTPGIYWIGGVVQNNPTTAVTMRIVGPSSFHPDCGVVVNVIAAGDVHYGYTMPGISGALPATFVPAAAGSGRTARLHMRTF